MKQQDVPVLILIWSENDKKNINNVSIEKSLLNMITKLAKNEALWKVPFWPIFWKDQDKVM